MFSQKNEYEADHYATETIDDPISLADALKKLSASNFSNLTPHPFYVFPNYSPLRRCFSACMRSSSMKRNVVGTANLN